MPALQDGQEPGAKLQFVLLLANKEPVCLPTAAHVLEIGRDKDAIAAELDGLVVTVINLSAILPVKMEVAVHLPALANVVASLLVPIVNRALQDGLELNANLDNHVLNVEEVEKPVKRLLDANQTSIIVLVTLAQDLAKFQPMSKDVSDVVEVVKSVKRLLDANLHLITAPVLPASTRAMFQVMEDVVLLAEDLVKFVTRSLVVAIPSIIALVEHVQEMDMYDRYSLSSPFFWFPHL